MGAMGEASSKCGARIVSCQCMLSNDWSLRDVIHDPGVNGDWLVDLET